jgi:hypothetical protein
VCFLHTDSDYNNNAFYLKECINKENTMRIKMLKAAVVGLVLSVSGFANAGLILHTDRTSWESGVGVYNTVDFNEYTSDISFEDNLLSIGHGMSIITSGTPVSGRNILDTSPFAFARTIDGTPDIMPDVNSTSTFSIFFDTLTTGWGADFRWMDAGTTIELYNGTTLLTSYIDLGNSSSQFIGFELTGSDALNRINFVRTSTGNDNIVLDNLSVTANAVPEPSTLAIFALAIMGLASRRFKKQ